MSVDLDFEAEEVKKSIPSRSNYAPSNKQRSYNAGETIRFHISPEAGQSFFDPRQSLLTFKVRVTDAVALVRFSNKCGLHSIIENVRITDNMNTPLENLQNYNEMAEKLHLYSENASIKHKRGLLEGVEYTSRNFGNNYFDNLPARTMDNSQLFNNPYQSGRTGTFEANASPTSDPNTIEVALHLYSGIIGSLSDKLFPVAVVDSLRIEIDTCVPEKCLELWSAEGIVSGSGEVLPEIGDGNSCRFGIIDTSNTAAPLTSVSLYAEVNPGFGQNATNVPATQAAINAGMRSVKNQCVGASNLVVGKDLWGWNNANPPVWKRMGTITAVSCANSGGAIFVLVGLGGAGNPNGSEFTGGPGGGTAGANVAYTNTCGMKLADVAVTPKVVLSDVQFIMKTAQPPQSYISSMMKQMNTAEGLKFDYLTMDTYRNNVLAGEKIIQLNIPTINRRATSLLTLPVDNQKDTAVYENNLETITDNASNYNYIIDGKFMPTRKVRLSQLSQGIPKTEQVALFEFEKALSSIRVHPKNLDYQKDNFSFGRALGRYGGVYDLSQTGNASLRVEYSNPLRNKLMVTFVGGLRRLVVSKDGRFVEM
jgi:hypothetical protein